MIMARQRRSPSAGSNGGVFARVIHGLAAEAAKAKAIIVDATSLRSKKRPDGQRDRLIGRTKGGMCAFHAIVGTHSTASRAADLTDGFMGSGLC